MTAKNAALRFTRDKLNAGYEARTETHRYMVSKHGHGWLLRILELTETSGIKHTIGQPVVAESTDDTRALSYAVANVYNDLGNDYAQHEHGGRRRITEAIIRAYEEN